MSEEEKHAIWYFSEAYDEEDEKQWKVIENLIEKQQGQLEEKTYLYNKLETESKWLIEKQQKEIEELKTITNGYNSYNVDNMNGYNIIIADSEYFAYGTFVNNYISKDKIREVLEKERKKQKERVDISLALHSQYISLIDKIKKQLLEED